MNIGVLGWWHNDNEGDLCILENMKRAVSPHRVVPIDLPFVLTDASLKRLNLLDYLILGGGGLFQDAPPPSPFAHFDEWGTQLETPISAIGIGVDNILPEYHRSVMALVAQASRFYVRDAASLHVVKHPQAQLAPDLSFLYPFQAPDATTNPSRQRPVCGVNLRQSAGLDVDKWSETLLKLPLDLRGIPMSTFASWSESAIMARIDPTSCRGFDAARYAGLDLMIGTAFHSVVFAIQAHIPVIAIAYAPKVQRLMADLDLAQFVLQPSEWHKLPDLVTQTLAARQEIQLHLRKVTEQLTVKIWHAATDVKEHIQNTPAKQTGAPHIVSLVVIASDVDAFTHATLDSCLKQTYPHIEVILLGDDPDFLQMADFSAGKVKFVKSEPDATRGERLNHAFAHATGAYWSWIVAGDTFALDAIAGMVSHLQCATECAMVFTDYYTVSKTGCIVQGHSAGPTNKLFRRNVVGPSFLYRRKLADVIGAYAAHTPLPDYDYWLRTHPRFKLQPLHTHLFFRQTANEARQQHYAERQVRQQWRATAPRLVRSMWRIIDTDFAERWVVEPALWIMRRVKALLQRSPIIDNER